MRYGVFFGVAAFALLSAPAFAEIKINPYPTGKAPAVSVPSLAPASEAPAEATGAPVDLTAAPAPAPVLKTSSSVDAAAAAVAPASGEVVAVRRVRPEVSPVAPTRAEYETQRKPYSFVNSLASRPRRFTSPSSASAASAASVPALSERSVQSDLQIRDVPVVPAIEPSLSSGHGVRSPYTGISRPVSERSTARDRTGSDFEWGAVEGADMKETLELWAKKEGVDFVWDGSHAGFEVVKTATFDQSFEEAVRGLLDQYKSNMVRPVGKLFQSGGKRVLVIDVVKGV